jgi:hypothetical protein
MPAPWGGTWGLSGRPVDDRHIPAPLTEAESNAADADATACAEQPPLGGAESSPQRPSPDRIRDTRSDALHGLSIPDTLRVMPAGPGDASAGTESPEN